MVNELTMKDHILALLSDAETHVSGEAMSRLLGISRVAVWKHIQAMIADGIAISAGRTGYRLDDDPDDLRPFRFREKASFMHHFPLTGSTMDEAAQLARDGCPAFTVAVAEHQSGGRGRLSRVWESAAGGLYFTIVIRPEAPTSYGGLFNLAAAVEMAQLVRERYGVDALVKWPNDILVQGKKLCGILSQVEAEAEQIRHLCIGIGLNVNNPVTTVNGSAVSLKQLGGKVVARRPILIEFINRFSACVDGFDPATVHRRWKSINHTLGRRVRVATVGDEYQGVAEDLDEYGGLILRGDDQRLMIVTHGDCFHES
jgi:BirA family biotin operon repressor/biotin-[acetyl-CoA-carboxylase] ligase